MARDGAGSVYAVRMRVCALDDDGSPLVGQSSAFVTDALIQADFTPNYEDGDDISVKNGSGRVCVAYKGPSTLKNISGSLSVCSPDPELNAVLTGGTLFLDGTDPIGYQGPRVGSAPVENGISVELWTRAIVGGAPAATLPYFHWAFPRLHPTPDQTTFEADALQPKINFDGEENPNWGDGPGHDFTQDSSACWQYMRTETVPPSQLGYVAVTA